MREIKFRGYDKKEKKWFYGLIVEIGAKLARICPSDTHGSVVVSIETIGQYTGVKDKTGKEIFEGDIVKDTGDYNFYKVVEWDEFRASFIGRIANCDDTQMVWAHHWIVVGNIYENPEILIEEQGK